MNQGGLAASAEVETLLDTMIEMEFQIVSRDHNPVVVCVRQRGSCVTVTTTETWEIYWPKDIRTGQNEL